VSDGSSLASSSSPATLSLTFTGSQIVIVYARHASLGAFAVKLDGLVVQTVNSRAPNTLSLARVTIPLTPGQHTLRLVSVKGSVVIDAFVVTP
jgi:hypothetical protein